MILVQQSDSQYTLQYGDVTLWLLHKQDGSLTIFSHYPAGRLVLMPNGANSIVLKVEP